MELSELAAYAKEKYHMSEEHKWASFPGFSVLADPNTGKWAALLMRQWDYETGSELQRCDIKCGRECLAEWKVPYLTKAFRMKGEKWVGVIFDGSTDQEVVFELFDRAVRAGQQGYTIVLEERTGEGRSEGGKIHRDTLLPLESLRGNYPKGTAQRTAPGASAPGATAPGTSAPAAGKPHAYTTAPGTGRPGADIPSRILEMMKLYEYGNGSFENKCRNFLRQGRFMEDYEDNTPWNAEFKRYFTTYHDLNLNQLRGYFSWRTRARRGEFHRISASLAYMYLYELLNGIGTASPGESLRKMKEFETGYLEAGYGDSSMRENLRRWKMEFAVLSGCSEEEIRAEIDPALLERDAHLSILRHPEDASEDEVFGALCALSDGKTERSPVLQREPEKGKHLFCEVWRYLSDHYSDDGWDIFTSCFGKMRKFPWHPLANAVYVDRPDREETTCAISDCRKYVYKGGEWFETRYDDLYFDRYRIHAIMHETDRQLRRYLRTGHYLRAKQGEEWITPYVEAVIAADQAAAAEAAKPKITIDLSGLDRIRRDALITQDSLLTEEEREDAAPAAPLHPQEEIDIRTRCDSQELSTASAQDENVSLGEEKASPAEQDFGTIRIPSLDEVHTQILLAVMRGEPVAELIRQEHLMPSIVTDTINEALQEEIGDNVLECEGEELTFVEDYREDVEFLIGGN